ncbi:tRNA1(Val) (adenine(37)-N6)-methyltransferase [Enterobacter sp. Bisph1]|uniref:tRNA(1)(Val) (adenine(37)-N(6))-methyltransferase TrmN n=1 Tax=Enterobacter sp. Bisph1 TaxID=1274399 RepID=UPI00057C19FA|nr:tRNA1(Val) (adenine(37)-N6)-methyltransferase [Enterobacter sp. Bisph1]
MLQPKPQLRRDGFTFKEFFVAHDRCAMKVGTDGVMLGAWSPVSKARHVLDIGTGSGLLALMLAQRTSQDVAITAVELDQQAAEQARTNVQASPWNQRITVHQADIRQWSTENTARYDLIVSNPPYFDEGVQCATPERDKARYTTTLDHQALLEIAAALITEEGFFCVVLPIEGCEVFTAKALKLGWHLRLRTDVSETESRLPHRVLLAFSPRDGELFADRLAIRGPDQRYSESYTALTQAFYLFM